MPNSNISSNKRIAKNVLALYARMLLMLFINFFTARILLDCLGVEDYGLNNVVGGFVAMLGFVNNSMTNSIQRFLNVELGKNDEVGARKCFETAMTVQLLISVVLLILLETLGIWFLNYKMHIPSNRYIAANWVYQCACMTFVLNIVKSPYNAIIIAKEKMNFYAIVSVLEALIKVGLILALLYVKTDRLIAYAILHFVSVLIFFMITVYYSKKLLPGIVIKIVKDKKRFKDILSFSGWNLFGSFSGVIKGQGINILINFFFSLAINAARSVAYMVLAAINQFASNFQVALNPQIVQSYASGDRERYLLLTYTSGKLSFYLMWIIIFPIIILLDPILSFWLGDNIPEKTQIFLPIILLTGLIDSLGSSISTPLYATGNIKKYQIIVSTITIMVLPISYILYKMGYPAESSMIVSLVLSVFAQIVRVIIWCSLIDEYPVVYLKQIVFPASIVVVISVVLIKLLMLTGISNVNGSIVNLVMIAVIIVVISAIIIYFVGLNKVEKTMLQNVIRNRIKKINCKK